MVVGSFVPVATGNGRVALLRDRKRRRQRRLAVVYSRSTKNGVAAYPPNEVSHASGRKRGAPSRRVPYGAFPLCEGEGAIATGGSSPRSTKNGVGPADAQERVPPEHGVAAGGSRLSRPMAHAGTHDQREGRASARPETAWATRVRSCASSSSVGVFLK